MYCAVLWIQVLVARHKYKSELLYRGVRFLLFCKSVPLAKRTNTCISLLPRCFQRPLPEAIPAECETRDVRDCWAAEQKNAAVLAGQHDYPGQTLPLPQLLHVHLPAGSWKRSKHFSSKKHLCNCCSKWKKACNQFRNNAALSIFPPTLGFWEGLRPVWGRGRLTLASGVCCHCSSDHLPCPMCPVLREPSWSRWDPPSCVPCQAAAVHYRNAERWYLTSFCVIFPRWSFLALLSSFLLPEGWVLLCSNVWDSNVSAPILP